MASQDRRLHRVLRAVPLFAVIALMLAFVPTALGAPSAPAGFGAAYYQDYVPLTIPNDYTACGVQYYAQSPSLLSPSTSYYVKPAFCQGAYNAASARGAIWNATTSQWIRTDAAWNQFPTFSTDGSGNVSAAWAYVEFGDDTQSGDWTLYFIARPVSGTDADAIVGNKTSAMKVLDMKTTGAWIHNGVSIYTSSTPTRVEINASSSTDRVTANTLAVYQSEVTGATDGAADIIPAAALTGGFRLWAPIPNPGYGATPSGSNIQVRINRKTLSGGGLSPVNPLYTNGTNFAVPPADTEMAVGLTTSADQTPPSAPASLTAVGSATSIKLTWPAATDNTAVTAFRVYRWTARPDGVTYSPEHKPIATVTPAGDGSGSYTDGDAALVDDTFYYYEVRAVDAASNIGPRSATAHALFGDKPPVTTATGLAADDHSDWTNATSPAFDLFATDPDQTKVRTTWILVNNVDGYVWSGNPVTVALHEGSNAVMYWSDDTAGLTETANTGYINIDRTAPVTTVSGVPTGWVKRPVELRFAASAAAGEAPIAYTEYRVGSGAWTKGGQVTVKRQGSTTVAYRSADTAGNVEAAKSCVVRIDDTAPVVKAFAPVTAWRGGILRFTFWVSDVSGPVSVKVGVTRYGHRVATYDFGRKPAGRRAAGAVVCSLPVGRYSWRVVVTDSAGNVTRTTARALKVLPGLR